MCDYSRAVREDGQIRGAIKLARDMKWTDSQIEKYLMETYHLSKEEAEEYLQPVSA